MESVYQRVAISSAVGRVAEGSARMIEASSHFLINHHRHALDKIESCVLSVRDLVHHQDKTVFLSALFVLLAMITVLASWPSSSDTISKMAEGGGEAEQAVSNTNEKNYQAVYRRSRLEEAHYEGELQEDAMLVCLPESGSPSSNDSAMTANTDDEDEERSHNSTSIDIISSSSKFLDYVKNDETATTATATSTSTSSPPATPARKSEDNSNDDDDETDAISIIGRRLLSKAMKIMESSRG